MVWSSAERVRASVLTSFSVDDLKVELSQHFPLSDLSSVELFCGSECGEVAVVCVDYDSVFSSKEVVFPLLKRFHDCHHLLVRDRVSHLCVVELFRHEGHRFWITLVVSLRELCAYSEVRGVGFDFEGFV